MQLVRTARNLLVSGLVALQVIAYPAFAFAQEAPAPATETAPKTTETAPTPAPETKPTAVTQPPAPGTPTTTRGTVTPTGADSNKYVKDADGNYTNGIYTWNPTTQQTKPVAPQDYSYNPTTGRWDTTEYVYSPESGKYIPNVKSVATNPNATASTGPGSMNRTMAANGGATINGTGPNSTNTINGNTTQNGTFDLFFNGAISNTLNSNATSGNSLVQGNTNAENSLTGNASSVANVINMLQSSYLGQDPNIASFISNIDGNVYGDLLIDPRLLPGYGSHNSNIDVNIDNNGVINNNINLAATSGNATVSGNTNAGDATSGDARAIANVLNLINSAVNAGQSFLGTININGNLDGDILLPLGLLQNLIANTGPNSSNTLGGTTTNNTDINSTTNRTINNNIQSAATTGNADVSRNTNAGSALTGTGTNTVNTQNIVGQNVTGKNGILVFVNVAGKWLGMVVGPAGATIYNTGPNSNNSINGGGTNNLTVAANENSQINNNITVAAQSGDASVTGNTNAGNARSGDASTTVNLANIIGSEINVEDWFGVLFINVFGSWAGNFGEDTEHGGFSQRAVATSGAASGGSGGSDAPQVFGFAPAAGSRGSGATGPLASGFGSITTAGVGVDVDQPVTEDQTDTRSNVLASTSSPSKGNGPTSVGSTSVAGTGVNLMLVAGIIGVMATTLVIGREVILARRETLLA